MEKYLYSKMSLSEIYNRLSKANKTPAWQRAIMNERFRKKNLAKAPLYGPADNGFSNGSTPENFIAPGGEFFLTPKAREMYLEMASGDAEEAQKLMQNALDQHNALYLKDQQPRGLEERRLPIPKEKRDFKDPDLYNSANRGYDPTAVISEINRQKDWPLYPGETQDQANARMDKMGREQTLPESMEQFTVPHEIINPKPLQNSFANQDAFNGISLHDLYNRLSKANKTPAWQRKEGQNPKGGLNAKGRASARAEGHNLKPPVKSGDNPRRASFLARMGNSPGPEYDEHGKPTRLLLSLQAWGASSKADAKRKAKAISARLKMSKAGTVSYDIINSSDEDDPLNWRQPDLTDEYNTELSPEQEAAYRKWTAIQKVPTTTHDYDLKGFFANQVFGKTDTSEHKGHFDDRWKKPNHMTFSDQSQYAEDLDGTSTGGRWIEHLSPKDDPEHGLGHYTFAMSRHQRIPEQAMRAYFQRVEPRHSFFEPISHTIHEGEIPLTDQHVDQLIKEGVAYPFLYGLQKIGNVRNLAPNGQLIGGVRLGGQTTNNPASSEMSSAPVIKAESPDMPVVPQTGTTLKTPKAPSLKGPGGFTPPPVPAGLGGFTPRPASTGPGGFTPPSPFPSVDSTKKSFFFLNTQEKTITDICMERLEKGRGEDARELFSNNSADQYDEKHYPTGKMINLGGKARVKYRGVFGENRNLLVEASSPKKKNTSEWYAEPVDMQQRSRFASSLYTPDPYIEWIHIKPGTVVTPHDTQQVFHSLYNAGFTGPNLTYTAIPDDDEVHLTTPLIRDRLFRPWVKKWKEFVASQPPAPYIDTTQPAGDREDEDPWEGMKEFHEPEVNLEQELNRWNEAFRRSWFSVSIRRSE